MADEFNTLTLVYITVDRNTKYSWMLISEHRMFAGIELISSVV